MGVDSGTVAQLSRVDALLYQVYQWLEENPPFQKGSKGKSLFASLTIWESLRLRLAGELGLTPAARAKLKIRRGKPTIAEVLSGSEVEVVDGHTDTDN